jgi:hypothetical protein
MRFVLQHVNVRPADRLDLWVQRRIHDLLPLIDIEEARIRLEYRAEASPRYHASAHLVIPGPDVRAEVVDHTARTALEKLLAELGARAIDRVERRERRHLRARPPRGMTRVAPLHA